MFGSLTDEVDLPQIPQEIGSAGRPHRVAEASPAPAHRRVHVPGDKCYGQYLVPNKRKENL